MGAGIGGTAVAQANIDVRFHDVDLRAVSKGLRASRKILDDRKKRRRLDRYEHRRRVDLLSGAADWSGFGRADLVIEAVPESLEIKQEVFRTIEEHVSDECVLASNTSTIPITQIAQGTRRPERVLGMHYFSPVEKMPLLEVIVGTQTAPWAAVTAVEFGRRMGKTVVVVRDYPGFWVNRILAPYLNEASRLVQEGVRIEVIDQTMRQFGFPVGPIKLLDEVGIDVGLHASRVLHEAFGDRMKPLDGLEALVQAGRSGRKRGVGFYRYEKGRKRNVDREVYQVLGAKAGSSLPVEEIEQRMVYAMLNEAAMALDEAVVRCPRDGDVAAIFGIGYPPFRGGPLRSLDRIGTESALDTLELLEQRHGPRFAPAPVLTRMAAAGDTFYPT
jgi:3-hydroxyacyl-CoA dehydrogenase/enoyl-CoA hydratase/3-hydroxybutyryl-CoA epimerase